MMNDRYPQSRLLIFTKAPVPGQVKTRLVPYMDEETAARLQQQLITRTVAMACHAALAPVELWLAGEVGHPCIDELARRFRINVRHQQGADLGERMHHAAADALEEVSRVIIIGSDSPAMDAETLRRAYTALEQDDVVFVPAEDGGYTLVGMKQARAALFTGIQWGGERVLEQSLRKAEGLGLSVSLLETAWDLDRPEDYERAVAGGWVEDVLGDMARQSGQECSGPD